MKDNKINTVVEVRCLYTSRFTSQRPKWVVLNGDRTYGLKPKSRYYYQVQAKMFVTGARCCVFGVFTNKLTYMYVMVVDRDDHFIQACVHALTSYYTQTYLLFLHEEHIEVPENIIEALQKLSLQVISIFFFKFF